MSIRRQMRAIARTRRVLEWLVEDATRGTTTELQLGREERTRIAVVASICVSLVCSDDETD